jgi:hypothetical protein
MKVKQNISDQSSNSEQPSPVLEKLRHEVSAFKVPDGYFDSLSPRIVDRIKKQENRSLLKAVIPQFSNRSVWRSAMAVMIFAALIVSYILVKKDTAALPDTDEWAQINMAYDASYAEDVLLAESLAFDKELETTDMSKIDNTEITHSEPSAEEILNYLKEQEIDTDILTEY